jgi:hypothetical protein
MMHLPSLTQPACDQVIITLTRCLVPFYGPISDKNVAVLVRISEKAMRLSMAQSIVQARRNSFHDRRMNLVASRLMGDQLGIILPPTHPLCFAIAFLSLCRISVPRSDAPLP